MRPEDVERELQEECANLAALLRSAMLGLDRAARLQLFRTAHDHLHHLESVLMLAQQLTQIEPYQPHRDLPPLPHRVTGSLRGVGIVVDNDGDHRLLLAVALQPHPDIVAIAEMTGSLQVYARQPIPVPTLLTVLDDEWSVSLHVPQNGRWVELPEHLVPWSQPHDAPLSVGAAP